MLQSPFGACQKDDRTRRFAKINRATECGLMEFMDLHQQHDADWPDQVIARSPSSEIFVQTVLHRGEGHASRGLAEDAVTPHAKESREKDMDMHATSEFVDRDLRRRQLARRLVTHQARTHTIFMLTGFSRHQLATLRQRWGIPQEIRHRGPRPTSFAIFNATLRVREEAAVLAVLWKILTGTGLAKDTAPRKLLPMEFGERLCEVFEIYATCFPSSELEFEHLVLLVRGLEQGDAIALSNCSSCEAVVLVDLLGTRRRLCSHCQNAASALVSTSQDAVSGETADPGATHRGGVQQELF